MNFFDVVIIGGGPAGLAAAISAWQNGAKEVLLIERDTELGGILNQCIHNGFGLHHFKTELTGPEYAERFIKLLQKTGVQVLSGTMVLSITQQDSSLSLSVTSPDGYNLIGTKSVVLAMGCRERTRGAIAIPGDRPAGVLTAGTAQRYVNIEGYMVGKRVVILGSGDIGLIMARRMTLEGAEVLACIEIMPHPGGLNRNIVQCLDDFGIPLYTSHTITAIQGKNRVESVTVAKVDENRIPITGSEFTLSCDCVLLSVGLIPENELSKALGVEIDSRTSGPVVYEDNQTSIPGVFACGNVLQVHDLVDFVTAESLRAGANAAAYASGVSKSSSAEDIILSPGENVSYALPQRIHRDHGVKFIETFFRVKEILREGRIDVLSGTQTLLSYDRDYLCPGEMEKIVIPAAVLDKAGAEGLQIKVSNI